MFGLDALAKQRVPFGTPMHAVRSLAIHISPQAVLFLHFHPGEIQQCYLMVAKSIQVP